MLGAILLGLASFAFGYWCRGWVDQDDLGTGDESGGGGAAPFTERARARVSGRVGTLRAEPRGPHASRLYDQSAGLLERSPKAGLEDRWPRIARVHKPNAVLHSGSDVDGGAA